jgi:hypothetical protein
MFTNIRTNLFGNVAGEKMWIVLNKGELFCYDNRFERTLIRKLSCKSIEDIQEIMCDKLEIKFESLSITLLPESNSHVGENIIWGWYYCFHIFVVLFFSLLTDWFSQGV